MAHRDKKARDKIADMMAMVSPEAGAAQALSGSSPLAEPQIMQQGPEPFLEAKTWTAPPLTGDPESPPDPLNLLYQESNPLLGDWGVYDQGGDVFMANNSTSDMVDLPNQGWEEGLYSKQLEHLPPGAPDPNSPVPEGYSGWMGPPDMHPSSFQHPLDKRSEYYAAQGVQKMDDYFANPPMAPEVSQGSIMDESYAADSEALLSGLPDLPPQLLEPSGPASAAPPGTLERMMQSQGKTMPDRKRGKVAGSKGEK
jgi:hypothetical protein